MLTIPGHKGNATFLPTPVRIAITKNTTNKLLARMWGKKEPSYIAGKNVS
jgi:hypothetical protein